MAGDALVTFDLGTTRLKVAAFAPGGELLAQEAARNREHRDGDRAWQDPDAWWSTACALTRRLIARPELDGRAVVGLSLSGRGGACVVLDGDGRVLAPAWSDRRHASQLALVTSGAGHAGALSSYASALLSKLLWLRDEAPDVARRVAHAMYAKDFLLFRMTGAAVTDPTSGPDAATWPEEPLAALDVDPSLLPTVRRPWETAGAVTSQAANALGVPAGLPVAVGGHDGICANVGAGAGGVGAYAVTIGTHAVVRAVTARQPAGSHRFYGLPPDRHVIGGNAVMAGRAADWFLDATGAPPDDEARAAAFRAFDAEASRVAPGADGVRFLPFLAGQRAPEERPGAAAAFTGLRTEHGRAQLYRAVLEGGAFAIRGVFEQVRDWCGEPSAVHFTGSAAQSAVWRQIIVDTLNTPIELTDASAEGRGAAIFLAVALGYYPDYDSAAAVMVTPAGRIEPDAERAASYERLYAEWLTVAEALRPLDR